jgi:hypothetical protein
MSASFKLLVQLVEHYIAQQWTEWAALWRTLLAWLKQTVGDDTCIEILVYQTDYSSVLYRPSEYFYKSTMTYRIEKAFQIKVYYVFVTTVDYPLCLS